MVIHNHTHETTHTRPHTPTHRDKHKPCQHTQLSKHTHTHTREHTQTLSTHTSVKTHTHTRPHTPTHTEINTNLVNIHQPCQHTHLSKHTHTHVNTHTQTWSTHTPQKLSTHTYLSTHTNTSTHTHTSVNTHKPYQHTQNTQCQHQTCHSTKAEGLKAQSALLVRNTGRELQWCQGGSVFIHPPRLGVLRPLHPGHHCATSRQEVTRPAEPHQLYKNFIETNGFDPFSRLSSLSNFTQTGTETPDAGNNDSGKTQAHCTFINMY